MAEGIEVGIYNQDSVQWIRDMQGEVAKLEGKIKTLESTISTLNSATSKTEKNTEKTKKGQKEIADIVNTLIGKVNALVKSYEKKAELTTANVKVDKELRQGINAINQEAKITEWQTLGIIKQNTSLGKSLTLMLRQIGVLKDLIASCTNEMKANDAALEKSRKESEKEAETLLKVSNAYEQEAESRRRVFDIAQSLEASEKQYSSVLKVVLKLKEKGYEISDKEISHLINEKKALDDLTVSVDKYYSNLVKVNQEQKEWDSRVAYDKAKIKERNIRAVTDSEVDAYLEISRDKKNFQNSMNFRNASELNRVRSLKNIEDAEFAFASKDFFPYTGIEFKQDNSFNDQLNALRNFRQLDNDYNYYLRKNEELSKARIDAERDFGYYQANKPQIQSDYYINRQRSDARARDERAWNWDYYQANKSQIKSDWINETKQNQEIEYERRKTLRENGLDDSSSVNRMQLIMGAVAAAGIKEATQGFLDFQSALSSAEGVINPTTEELKALSDISREMGENTVFTAKEAAEGVKYLGMAGMKTNEIVRVLPDTLNLASAGELDLGRAADIATNIMSAFNMEAKDFTIAADSLAYAAANSNTDIEQLAQGMKYAGPSARAAGVSLKDTTAILGTLANAGIQASTGGTSLRMMLSSLSKDATPKAKKSLKELGLEFKDVSLESNNLLDIIEKLAGQNPSGQVITLGQAINIFGVRAANSILALTSNVDGLRELQRGLDNCAGEAERIAKVKMSNIIGDIKMLKSAIEGLVITLFNGGVSNAIRHSIQDTRDLVTALSYIPKKLEEYGYELDKVIKKNTDIKGSGIVDYISALKDVFDRSGGVVGNLSKAMATLVGINVAKWAIDSASGVGTFNKMIAVLNGSAMSATTWIGAKSMLVSPMGVGGQIAASVIIAGISTAVVKEIIDIQKGTYKAEYETEKNRNTLISQPIVTETQGKEIIRTFLENNAEKIGEDWYKSKTKGLTASSPYEYTFKINSISSEKDRLIAGLKNGNASDITELLSGSPEFKDAYDKLVKLYSKESLQIINNYRKKQQENAKAASINLDKDTAISLATYTEKYASDVELNEFIKNSLNNKNIDRRIRNPEALQSVFEIARQTNLDPYELVNSETNKQEIQNFQKFFFESFGGKSGKKYGNAYVKLENQVAKEQEKAEKEAKKLEEQRVKYERVFGERPDEQMSYEDMKLSMAEQKELIKLQKEEAKRESRDQKIYEQKLKMAKQIEKLGGSYDSDWSLDAFKFHLNAITEYELERQKYAKEDEKRLKEEAKEEAKRLKEEAKKERENQKIYDEKIKVVKQIEKLGGSYDSNQSLDALKFHLDEMKTHEEELKYYAKEDEKRLKKEAKKESYDQKIYEQKLKITKEIEALGGSYDGNQSLDALKSHLDEIKAHEEELRRYAKEDKAIADEYEERRKLIQRLHDIDYYGGDVISMNIEALRDTVAREEKQAKYVKTSIAEDEKKAKMLEKQRAEEERQAKKLARQKASEAAKAEREKQRYQALLSKQSRYYNKTVASPIFNASMDIRASEIEGNGDKVYEAYGDLFNIPMVQNLTDIVFGNAIGTNARNAFGTQFSTPKIIRARNKAYQKQLKEQEEQEKQMLSNSRNIEKTLGNASFNLDKLNAEKDYLSGHTYSEYKKHKASIDRRAKAEEELKRYNASEEEIQQLTRIYEEYDKVSDAMDRVLQKKQQQQQFITDISSGIAGAVTNAHTLREAFIELGNVAENVLRNMASQMIQHGLENFFTNAFSRKSSGVGEVASLLDPGIMSLSFLAHGGALQNGRLTAYARGGIVNRPTIFPMAHGMGLMGEAGAEAVMPLRRTASGDLGVQVSGGSSRGSLVIAPQITINAEGGSKDENKDAAERIDSTVRQALDDMVMNVIIREQRPGGTLYR